MPDHLLDLAEAHLRHVLADLFGHEEHEVHDVFRLAAETLAQLRVLRGHADRAGVEVADAHHDAPAHHQRCGGETRTLGAKQRGDDHLPPSSPPVGPRTTRSRMVLARPS